MLNHFRRTLHQILPRRAILVGPRPAVVVGPAAGAPGIVIGPSERAPILVGPGAGASVPMAVPGRPAIQVAPPRRAVWEEKGWALENGRQPVYRGVFQVTDRRTGQRHRFNGRIEAARNEFTPYVHEPPAGIRSHPKGPCFNLVDHNWYRVHWHRPARNVDDTILYVERVLDEVINRRLT